MIRKLVFIVLVVTLITPQPPASTGRLRLYGAVGSESRPGGQGYALRPAAMRSSGKKIKDLRLGYFADPSGSNRQLAEKMLTAILEVAAKFSFPFASGRDSEGPVVARKPAGEIKALFQNELPLEEGSFEEILSHYEQDVQELSVNAGNPAYAAHLTPYSPIIAKLVEILIATIDPNQIAFNTSPGGTFAELEVIRWLLEIVGYDTKEGGGSFVPGGTFANQEALLIARNYMIHKLLEAKRGPLQSREITEVTRIGLSQAVERLKIFDPTFSGNLVIFASEAAHYSHEKLMGYIGLGSNNLIKVKTENGIMDPSELRSQIESHKAKGDIVLAVLATAGTTEEGLFDPLEEIAEIASKNEIWMHVDAAYGGAVKLSHKYRDVARGLELADSVTIDPHKLLFMPHEAGVILFKDKSDLAHLKQSAAYVLREDEEDEAEVNLGATTTQGSKRFNSLKLWFALQLMGTETFGIFIDYLIDQTREIAAWLKQRDDFEVIRDPVINAYCFRYIPAELKTQLETAKGSRLESLNTYLNALNRKLNDVLMEHGYFHFARTTLKNTPYRTEDKASEGSNLEVFMNVNLNVYTNQQLLQSLLERVAAVGYDLHRGDPEPGENILQLINAGKAIAGCA